MQHYLKYLSSFFFPVCVVWFLASGPHTAGTALVWTLPLWLLVAVDWFSPKIDPERRQQILADGYYDAILYLLAFLQFLIIGLLLVTASQLHWQSMPATATSIVNLIVMRILVGTTSGSSAIIVAHELIHRRPRHLRVLGRLLLYTVCYEHFVIAHLRGHHRRVATPEDIATARLGESFDAYWRRVYVEQFKYAWNSELQRLGLTHSPWHSRKMFGNTVLRGLLMEIMLVLLFLAFFGWAAAIIFLYQALSGVRLLETINYYQHWGLEHGKAGNVLAWVNQSGFSHYALIGLANHIGHHRRAATAFQKLPQLQQGPKMPYGYFVTNLWVKLHNSSYRRISERQLLKYLKNSSQTISTP